MLRDRCKVIVQTDWDGSAVHAMIALHARRSAASVEGYKDRFPGAPLAVVLSGTDLYRDLPESREAIASLDRADAIVVLQDDAQRLLQPRWKAKSRVIFQSARPLPARPKASGRLHCVAVGHLRGEKDPATLFEAFARIPREAPITLRHIGAPLDEALARAARDLERRDPRYRYSGAVPHGPARAAIAAAHVLVHPSIMEGGANVIVEAVTAGTPVIASRVSGNVGMLGEDYPGYFAVRDAGELAERLIAAWRRPAQLAQLRAACARRRPLFRPATEQRAVRQLLADLLG